MSGGRTENRYGSPIDAAPAAGSAARQGFTAWLDDADVAADVADELTVAFSELVANAIVASEGCDRQIRVGSWFDGDDLVLEVANPIEPGSPSSIEHWDLDDPLRAGGRGLVIVRAYTDDLSVSSTEDMVVVRCRRHLEGDPPA